MYLNTDRTTNPVDRKTESIHFREDFHTLLELPTQQLIQQIERLKLIHVNEEEYTLLEL